MKYFWLGSLLVIVGFIVGYNINNVKENNFNSKSAALQYIVDSSDYNYDRDSGIITISNEISNNVIAISDTKIIIDSKFISALDKLEEYKFLSIHLNSD